MDFVLLDLIQLSQNGIILCDCHLIVEDANILTEPEKIAFMLKEPHNLVDDYCNRPDHQAFSDFIHSATDFEKAKAICNETLYTLNEKHYNDVKRSEYFWLERDDTRSIDETVELVERHFGWNLLSGLSVVKVEKDTELAKELLLFVKSCSWIEAKEHIADMIETWAFTDWEAMFVAIKDKRIVGMTSIMKTDYYPLNEIYPWVSSVFVSEEYRGQRISERLISYANQYAKEQGFKRSYIPTDKVGIYEHYGYHYLRDIVNYGGGVDHLFVKEL